MVAGPTRACPSKPRSRRAGDLVQHARCSEDAIRRTSELQLLGRRRLERSEVITGDAGSLEQGNGHSQRELSTNKRVDISASCHPRRAPNTAWRRRLGTISFQAMMSREQRTAFSALIVPLTSSDCGSESRRLLKPGGAAAEVAGARRKRPMSRSLEHDSLGKLLYFTVDVCLLR